MIHHLTGSQMFFLYSTARFNYHVQEIYCPIIYIICNSFFKNTVFHQPNSYVSEIISFFLFFFFINRSFMWMEASNKSFSKKIKKKKIEFLEIICYKNRSNNWKIKQRNFAIRQLKL